MTELQNHILKIFRYIDEICEANNICYYAIGGTCLGAVRHKGFIPWDDDIDIAMPRNDYERFLKIAPTQLPPNLKVIAKHDIAKRGLFWSKIHDVSTTFIEDLEINASSRFKGVFVDIMPLDGLPDNRFVRMLHFLRLRINGKLNFVRVYGLGYEGTKSRIWKLVKKVTDRHPYYYYFEQREKLLTKYDFDTSKLSCYGWSRECNRIVFPAEDFKNHVVLSFEDFRMRCPQGYDNFLTIMFGNYMELPPENKRVSHAMFVDLERPYNYYQKHGLDCVKKEGE